MIELTLVVVIFSFFLTGLVSGNGFFLKWCAVSSAGITSGFIGMLGLHPAFVIVGVLFILFLYMNNVKRAK